MVCGMATHTDLVGSSEACRLLNNIDKATLSRWVRDGKVKPAHKLPGRNGAFLFDRAEIGRVAAEQEESATEQPA